MLRLLILIFLAIGSLSFLGCTPIGPIRVTADLPPDDAGKLPDQPRFDVEKSRECKNNNEHCVYIVEYDEFGNVFSRAQLNASLLAAQKVAEEGGSVIVYVHGWHHSAKPGDENIEDFLDSVSEASQQADTKAVGIYIGWRGDSINSNNLALKLPSYAFTFWGRKATAHAIGSGGGVSELFRKLSSIRANSDSRLVILGHSFGGAIVYSSVAQLLAEQISLDAAPGDDEEVYLLSEGFNPVADLIVLLNPAFEAMRIAPLFTFARSHEYQEGLPPRLVVITSTADWATKVAFPVGRSLGTIFQGYPDAHSGKPNRRAIGHYVPYITHQLVVGACDNQPLMDRNKILSALNPEDTKAKNDNSICFPADGSESSLILTRCDAQDDCQKVTDGHFITRGLATEGYLPYRFPIANIRTNASVIAGHNDIWEENITRFLQGLLEEALENPHDLPMAPPG